MLDDKQLKDHEMPLAHAPNQNTINLSRRKSRTTAPVSKHWLFLVLHILHITVTSVIVSCYISESHTGITAD